MDRSIKSLSTPVALRDEELGAVSGGTSIPGLPDLGELLKITTQVATNVNVGGPQIAVVLGAIGPVSLAQGQALGNSSSQSA